MANGKLGKGHFDAVLPLEGKERWGFCTRFAFCKESFAENNSSRWYQHVAVFPV
jgi:hypothetical protein